MHCTVQGQTLPLEINGKFKKEKKTCKIDPTNIYTTEMNWWDCKRANSKNLYIYKMQNLIK